MPSSSNTVTVRWRATVLGAFGEGWRRALHAPVVTCGVLILTWLVALPLAAGLRDQISQQLGSSRVGDRLASGWDDEWATEFAADAHGIAGTFTREVLGFGGTLATLSRLLDGQPLPRGLATAVGAYLLAWLFLSGGILDRFARARPVATSTFFATCGVFFFRFLRMAVVVGAVYGAVFLWVQPWLLGTVFDWGTRDLANEHQGLVLRGWLYGGLVLVLALVNLVADMAKVRAVLEDRHSAIASLLAGSRFVRRRFWRCAGLYLVNVVGLLVLTRLWLQIAPTASDAGWRALLAGQLYLIARIWARLAFMASEVVFFQAELAHARFAAASEPVWPDSPPAEVARP
ncbi:MAG: hypothetical protein ABI634_01090 [Acidobacteriota bacterium]